MSPTKDLVSQQRAAAAKEKQKAEQDKLAKENPALAKQKERQAAALKARMAGDKTPKGKQPANGR